MYDDVIRQAQKGDQAAFAQLVERYSSISNRTARVLLYDRDAADDAVQEAWLDVWQALPRFTLGRPFRPWLLTIVANRCRMRIRRRRFIHVPYNDTLDASVGGTDGGIGRIMQTVEDAELTHALAVLPIEQQRILALRFYADLQLDEIATLLHIPSSTVKSRLYRALAALRVRLHDDTKQEIMERDV